MHTAGTSHSVDSVLRTVQVHMASDFTVCMYVHTLVHTHVDT